MKLHWSMIYWKIRKHVLLKLLRFCKTRLTSRDPGILRKLLWCAAKNLFRWVRMFCCHELGYCIPNNGFFVRFNTHQKQRVCAQNKLRGIRGVMCDYTLCWLERRLCLCGAWWTTISFFPHLTCRDSDILSFAPLLYVLTWIPLFLFHQTVLAPLLAYSPFEGFKSKICCTISIWTSFWIVLWINAQWTSCHFRSIDLFDWQLSKFGWIRSHKFSSFSNWGMHNIGDN